MANTFIRKMLEEYSGSNPARFHMPGHKGKVNPYDVTEISITDDLNNPQTYILDAQKALSKSFKSAQSFFMVNGSTSSIHAMLKYASLHSSYPILISRNSHKSILAGCMLFNIDTIILEEEFDNEIQAFAFNEKDVIDAMNNNKLSAVVFTSVDYFGRTIDISNISKICRERAILLLCDEAHGAHFHISDMLPPSALSRVDICVHSPHKTLSALTQCSYVHLSNSIDIDKFESIIHSLQTSSPSFLLIESMDSARFCADTMKAEWEDRIKSAKKLIDNLNKIDGIKVADTNWAKKCGYYNKDITRLVIDVSNIGNGIEIGKALESKYNIFMEMCTFRYLVAILTPWDKKEWDEMLYNALFEISKIKKNLCKIPSYPTNHIKAMDLSEAENSNWEKVMLKDAANRICAVSIGVYPPGVPLVLPGEFISQEAIDYMLEVKRLGGSLFGAEKGYVCCVKGEH